MNHPPRVALFADTFHEINGAANFLRRLTSYAKDNGHPLLCIRSGCETKLTDDGSVQLTELAWKRWLTQIESTLHATSGEVPSFQVQIVDRVRNFVESLPGESGPEFQEEVGAGCELFGRADSDET